MKMARGDSKNIVSHHKKILMGVSAEDFVEFHGFIFNCLPADTQEVEEIKNMISLLTEEGVEPGKIIKDNFKFGVKKEHLNKLLSFRKESLQDNLLKISSMMGLDGKNVAV